MNHETDTSIPPLPTYNEFHQFFLYIAYDTINEKFFSKTRKDSDPNSNAQGYQQYKKFVQNNKDTEWAKVLLASVSVVQAAKNHYKTLLPMLSSRNMGALHKVCSDITSNSLPPHKEVRNLERCHITGVWHERCIDISKGGRGSSSVIDPTDFMQDNLKTPEVSSTSSSVLPSPSPSHISITTPNHGSSSIDSSVLTPLRTVHMQQTMYGSTSMSGSTSGGLFVSPKFRHFTHMLWTVSKLDIVIKNYTTSWLQVQPTSNLCSPNPTNLIV